MDETYAEDSFVVGSDVEELESSEEEAEDIELMPEDSFVDGKRQYATRRRVFLHRARVGAGSNTAAPPEQRVKTKRSRVIRMNDSSEEEAEDVSKKKCPVSGGGVADPIRSSAAQQEHSKLLLNQKPSSSSSAIASKLSLLCKAQSRPEEQQDER